MNKMGQDTQPVKAMIAPKFKATAPKGIWSPSTTPTPVRKNQPADQQPPQQQQSTPTASSRSGAKSPAPTPPPPPTFWAPSPSPTPDRREFRPVKFESPAPVRKVYTAQADSAATVSTTAATPPWTQQQQSSERLTNAQSAPFRVSDTNKTKPQQTAAATSAPHHKVSFADATAPQPSAVQQTGRSATTSSTSVQESHHSSSSCFSQQQSKFERHHQISSSSSGGSNNQQTQSSAAIRSNEVVHPIQYIERVNEAQPSATTAAAAATLPTISMKQTTAEAAQTSSAVPARKSSDIGPTTKDGMPIVLRSEVDEDLHHKWYKRMYNTLHKVHQDDDSVTVRYKTRRGRYPYKSNGYLSEPEPHYDSDYATKYSTLDRRRLAIAGEQPHSPPTTTTTTYAAGRHHQMYNDDKYYGTLPNPVKSTAGVYKNQPGKIENFLPGQSSVSEKERKDRLEQERSVPRAYHEGYLSKALKDQGYESDSTLVFRKKELQQIGQLSGEQQKQAYLNLQAGGEVPVHGFRKLAPEKPKDTEVNPPPPPPPKGVPLHANPNINGNGHAAASVANGHDQHDGPQQDDDPESPRRYVESDVNIHYKTPVRFEYKDAVPELELAQRQSEHMRKLYQEERRRKYLQELQDQSNRRHADYFTPSQKSPISLHRYDDFGAEVLASPTPPRIIARALYNFQGLTARELSFKKGDIIYIRREIDRNWFEGEHNAMIGLLPSNYVEIISRDGSRVPAARKPAEGQARAKFNFHAQSAIELSLNKGELVSLTRRVDDNWFEGRIANRKGIFPVSYVDVLTDIGSVDTPYIAVTAKVATATNNSAPLSIVPTHDYTASRGGITSSSSTTTINNIGSSDALLHNLNNNNNSHNAINHNHQHAIQQQQQQHQQQQLAKHNAGSGAYTSYASSSQKTAPAAGGAIVRETQTLQKTEVLHVDTASEPLAYRAIYTYRPQNSDELELHEGDTVYVLEKCDDGWFVGTSQRSGCFGTFPGNYVERI